MDDQTRVNELIAAVQEILEEDEYNRYTREKLHEIVFVLGEEIDLSLRVDRVRGILESLNENPSTDALLRTQLWNLSASLDLF